MAALKNMHVFLKEVSPEKRAPFIKYIIQTQEEAGKSEWRLRLLLAQNLGNYCELFDHETVYAEFLPMFLKFCSDNVVKVGQAACTAMSPIIEKFNDDLVKQAAIVKVIRNKYFKAKTYKKRQLFIMMCSGGMMMKKELFEKYFKYDFISMASDRVPNVRIALSKSLRYHFLREISGCFVNDRDVNDAVRVLKLDQCIDVRSPVMDIETFPMEETRDVTMESFLGSINESRGRNHSDSGSITSEDDLKIEMEISRHNSEDEVDHGPVLKSLRQERL